VKNTYYKQHKTPPDVQALWEGRASRPKPEYRTPLRDFDKYLDTKAHGIYRAKTLKGIWATAPFLHNGSVPTIYHLLLPASQRPAMFRLGTREYDGEVIMFSRAIVSRPRPPCSRLPTTTCSAIGTRVTSGGFIRS
jgi:hypothetical protein